MDKSPLRVTINPAYSSRLKPIRTPGSIPSRWLGTPIEALINAHNFDSPIEPAGKPELIVVTCIEFRFQPMVPGFYSYVIRKAGGRVLGAEFTIAYALAKGVKHMALVGHNDCGMTHVPENVDAMTAALVEQEWPADVARKYVLSQGPAHSISDEVDALRDEYQRLRRLFRNIEVAPLFAALGNNQLYLPNWYAEEEGQTNESLPPVSATELEQLP